MKSMMKLTTQTGPYLALFLALAAFSLSAQAHEDRLFGRYAVQLGTSNEDPLLVGENVRVEFFALYDTVGNGDFADYVYLDRSAGDTVELAVIPITVASESVSAPFVAANHGIKTNFSQTIIEEAIGYQSSLFKLNSKDVGNNGPQSGYLGYYLTAYLKKAGTSGPGKTIVLNKFVCGAGSLDLPGSGFECVSP
jgi:hypothetical protein